MHCSACGTVVRDGEAFCGNCGREAVVVNVATESDGAALGMVIGGFFCAAVALLLIPPLFGIIGIVLGVLANKRGHQLGIAVSVTSAIAMVVGFILGALELMAMM